MNTRQIDDVMSAISGVVSVHQGDNTVFAKGYGMAHRAEAIPIQVDTRFATASGTKTFTAVAIAHLVEQGKFNFNTPVRECLDIDFSHWDTSVTVHHLLTHSSGIGDYFDEETQPDEDFAKLFIEKPTYMVQRPADILSWFQHKPMKFIPGERFAYCNAGFVVLGLIIEQHSGMTYTDYIEQQVFERAGMVDSGCFRMDELPPRTAMGYTEDGRTNIFSVPVIAMPDGGAFTTAPDMVRFWKSLISHQLLKPETTEQILKSHIAVNDNTFYSYGHWISSRGAMRCHQAIGGDPGIEFHSGYFPQDNTIISVICNQNLEADVFWPIVRSVLPDWD